MLPAVIRVLVDYFFICQKLTKTHNAFHIKFHLFNFSTFNSKIYLYHC